MTEEAERIKLSDRDSQHKSVLRFNMFLKRNGRPRLWRSRQFRIGTHILVFTKVELEPCQKPNDPQQINLVP